MAARAKPTTTATTARAAPAASTRAPSAAGAGTAQGEGAGKPELPPRAVRVSRTRAAAAPAPDPTARIAVLEEMVAALTARVAALEGRGAPAAATIDPAALRAAVIQAIEHVDAATRAGGLVPIPEVRAELRRRGVGAGDADVTAALDALEHEWRIDLSVAQDPSQVADRAAGIERPGRGLLYYVARR